MQTVGKVRVYFNTPLAQQMGESFTTELAAAFGDEVQRRAKDNVAPGRGPGPHPHPPPPAWQHVDTGRLMESIGADIEKRLNVVNVMVSTPVPYGVFLEAGWHTQSGRFVRYPWLAPAIADTQRDFMRLVRAKADTAFRGGPRGGLIRVNTGSNIWDSYSRGWKRAGGK